MDKTKKFFNDVVFYSASTFFSNILNFITGIVIRRILQPALMGLFNEMMLIFDYARYSHLGIIDSLDRELPYFYGRKDYKRVELLRDIGFTICLMVTLCISAGILAASFFIKVTNSRLFVNGVRIVALMIIFRLINSLYIVLNRSRNRFSIISKYTVIIAVADVIIKVILVIKFGLYGLLWASLLTWIIGLLYFYKASGEKFRFVLSIPFYEVRRLFKIGFPIFIMGFVAMTLTSIDRIMIIKLLDAERLGFYTIALMVSSYMLQLPSLVYGVIFPRFYQAYGEKQNIFEIKELFMKPTMVFAYFFPVFTGLVILALPLLIRYLLPAYMPGLLPAYLLLLGYSFISLVNMSGYLLIALNKQVKMIVIGVICIFIGIILNWLFIRKFNLELTGVAIGTSITFFVYTTILTAYAFMNYTKKIFAHLKFFMELYFPFFWVLILLATLRAFVFKTSGDILKDVYIISFKGLIFVLCCIPLVLYANKKTAILTLLKGTYLKKRIS
jgi:O-antigen/teichoic acid export membrane protein